MTSYIIKDSGLLARCIEHIGNLNPEITWEVVIKKYRKSKTGAQRRYFHKILQEVSDYTGFEMEDLKMEIKYRVLPLKEVTVDGKKHLYPISSEQTTTAQYNDLIDSALMLASEAGVSVSSSSHWGYA